MRIRAVKIENDFISLTPHCALDFERAITEAIITDIIFERYGFFADCLAYQMLHRTVVSHQKFVHRRCKDVLTETIADLGNTQLRNTTGSNDRMQIRFVPFGHATLKHCNLENVFLEFAFSVELDGG